MFRPALFLFLVALLLQLAPAQVPQETHSRIRASLAERNYLSVAGGLRDLESTDPAGYLENNYDYLRARVSEKSGDAATAMAAYQSVVNRGSILKPYALWHLAEIAKTSGNLTLERLYLQELISFSPESLLLYPAARRMAQSWFESANYDLAIRQIEQMPKTSAKPGTRAAEQIARELQAFLAEANLRSGNTAKARELFASLITNLANPAQPDDFALAGARGLDSMETTAGIAQLSDYEHLTRASIYQFNRDFEHARIHYAAIINDHAGSGLVPDAIFQTGRGYVQQGDFTEGLKWFERVLEQFPDHAIAPEALLQTASAYARVGKHHEAGTRYKRYIEKYPEGERIDRAYLNMIDILRDVREETAAIKWAGTVRDKFKGKQPEALATFAEARIYLARGDWPNALPILEALEKLPDLGGPNTPGGTSVAEVRFLRGFVLEQLRRYPEAIELYLGIPDGRNEYYGWRASEHLKLMASDKQAGASITAKAAALGKGAPTDPDGARRNIQARLRLTDLPEERAKLLASLRTAYAAIPAYSSLPKFKLVNLGRETTIEPKPNAKPLARTVADELLFLGLYDEAAPEIESARGAANPTPLPSSAVSKADIDYTIANFYTRGDLANRGSSFIESSSKIPADFQIELIPADVLDLLYPAPYVDALIRYGPQSNVDPRFLLSIMRQESRFRADVKSYAAARGLMQFISTTSTRIAAELGRENFRQDDLYDPATSILFGSHYISNLFKLFPRQPEAVAASYNGGEDNMQRWLSRSRSGLPDRYIPEIAFSQSKDYVYKVMSNFRMYQTLYDEDLKRR
ncbi:MAG TPA: transglycosylase SLT domain-containing protein [Pyrinomonadaceae bacterium]|nr:transglycosylase SLT domain-containing protein [Pyrinomonadaceae bacterium]